LLTGGKGVKSKKDAIGNPGRYSGYRIETQRQIFRIVEILVRATDQDE
jgi:hypothetical protein